MCFFQKRKKYILLQEFILLSARQPLRDKWTNAIWMLGCFMRVMGFSCVAIVAWDRGAPENALLGAAVLWSIAILILSM